MGELAIAADAAAHVADWSWKEYYLDAGDFDELELVITWAAYRAESGRLITGARSATFIGPTYEALG